MGNVRWKCSSSVEVESAWEAISNGEFYFISLGGVEKTIARKIFKIVGARYFARKIFCTAFRCGNGSHEVTQVICGVAGISRLEEVFLLLIQLDKAGVIICSSSLTSFIARGLLKRQMC
ncbi:hypothetical protein KC19_2G092200 [Ceratodon purpureus]|uniref:Uncharacterized protein n=1 Tax=Ceratodon purpureus TaxID=3225 RepID=A0A8T0IVS3_CERPU|nr:hypothetical protein KC19_2G092200 [Ceratodon purpureus]